MNLLQAELLAKRDRHGNLLDEDALEIARKKIDVYKRSDGSGKGNIPHNINRPAKKDVPLIKSQPQEEGFNDGSSYQPASRVNFPYF